jgi:hypothetical protein
MIGAIRAANYPELNPITTSSILTSQFIAEELVMDTNATNGFLSTCASQQHLPLPLNLFDYIANLAIKLPSPNQAKPARITSVKNNLFNPLIQHSKENELRYP